MKYGVWKNPPYFLCLSLVAQVATQVKLISFKVAHVGGRLLFGLGHGIIPLSSQNSKEYYDNPQKYNRN